MTATILLIAKLSIALAVVIFIAVKLAGRAIRNEKEANERSTKILEGLPVACFILDSNCVAIECNHTAVKLFAHKSFSQHVDDVVINGKDLDGCTECEPCEKQFFKGCSVREYLLKNTATLVFGKDEVEYSFEWIKNKCQEAKKNRVCQFEHEHQTLHGELVPCAVTIVHITYKETDSYSVYIQDLRATRKMIDEMRLRQIAEEESLAKTRFLARMSHEIRTPLNAVLGTTQMELRKQHPSETISAFLRIQNSSNLLLSIINDILDLSKVESGKFEVVSAPFVSESFILEILQINHMHIENPDIDFRLRVDENLPKHQIGDVVRLKQIVNNLLSNAFKYTKRGFVELAISAEIIDGYSGAVFIYKVKDNGMGMTKTQVDNLFSEFARFNLEENQAIEGIGLGMPIVQQLVLMMDGTISVVSEPDMGTEITIKIPQEIKGGEVIGKAAKKALENLEFLQQAPDRNEKEELVLMPYGKVLVVDDMETNLDIMEGILSMYEIGAEIVGGGMEALAKIKSGEEYDVIFMDHMMPDLDGIETTRRIRDMGYIKPIIALTANALLDNREMFLSSGFSEFMSKPIELEELDRNLKKFVMR